MSKVSGSGDLGCVEALVVFTYLPIRATVISQLIWRLLLSRVVQF